MSLCLSASPSAFPGPTVEAVPDRLATRLFRFLTPSAFAGERTIDPGELAASPRRPDAPDVNVLLL